MPMAAGACWRGERGDNESGVPLVGFPFFFMGPGMAQVILAWAAREFFSPIFPGRARFFTWPRAIFWLPRSRRQIFWGREVFKGTLYAVAPYVSET